MYKRLMLLFGLSITAVIANHAIFWSLNVQHVWAEPLPLRPLWGGVSINTVFTGFLIAVKKLCTFCVPAFLFASGYFAAYSNRKPGAGSHLKTIGNRVLTLVGPYVLWSLLLFLINPFQEETTPGKILARLLYGGAVPEYYFVPLLIQFTILAPFLVGLARNRPRLLLLAAAAMQLGVAGLSYLNVFWPVPYIGHILQINRTWSVFPTWAFFFPLGMVVNFHQSSFQRSIHRNRFWLVAGAVIFGMLAVLENEVFLLPNGVNWRDSALTLPTVLYALCMIGVFLAFETTRSALAEPLFFLANKTYTIYLIHPAVIALAMRVVDQWLFPILSFPYLFLLILAVLGLGVPVAIIQLARQFVSASIYKYVFG